LQSQPLGGGLLSGFSGLLGWNSMINQCQSCGSFDDLQLCDHCKIALVCLRCKGHHVMTCEENQKKKARGQGPTVRQIFTKPAPIPDNVDQGIQAVNDLLKEDNG
jgi:recombinational DNA repair protein (RecF pathway)